MIEGHKEYGLIGFPLEHSYSPRIFKEFFRTRPDCSYNLFASPVLSDETFHRFLEERPDLVGFNVTVPYKKTVMHYLSELTPQASAVGAVNTVLVKNFPDGSRALLGHNTDVDGVKVTLAQFPFHSRALILGTGGASMAVAAALKELGVDFVKVSRKSSPEYLTYKDLTEEIIKSHTLIINTTPVGMFPYVDDMPDFPVHFLGPEHMVFDLIYNPSPTMLMKQAKKYGAKTTGGIVMLRAQAEAALRFWDDYND